MVIAPFASERGKLFWKLHYGVIFFFSYTLQISQLRKATYLNLATCRTKFKRQKDRLKDKSHVDSVPATQFFSPEAISVMCVYVYIIFT